MADIVIKCPSTGETVATGLTMEKAEFDRTDEIGMHTFQCPACNEMHTWNKRDAFLRDCPTGMD